MQKKTPNKAPQLTDFERSEKSAGELGRWTAHRTVNVLCKHMSYKPIFRLSLLAVVILLVACSPKQRPPSQATPIPRTASCGVGLLDTNVRIWIDGQDAEKACGSVTAMIRQQGNQPTDWDGQLSESANSYRPVCSDALPTLRYEVVDTGNHFYGTEWCHWMVSVHGSSGSATTPDLFGIVSAAQQAENAQQQTQNAASQATKEAQQLIYTTACKQHNGHIDNGYCVVDYPGWSSQRVTINPDGIWDAVEADINRANCETAMQDASAAAQDGQPWSNPPQYHPDTGVCVHGNP